MRTIKPIGLAFVLTAALALLLTAAVSARCLDLDDDCRLPAPTPTWLPLWTQAPAPAVGLDMSTDIPPLPTVETLSGYPALPPTATPASGYPAQPTVSYPTVTASPPPTETPPAESVCALDWARPFSEQARRDLGRCLGVLLNGGYPPAAVCPPADSLWRPYFSPPCPAP